jgi:myo-inositol-1(or 4)-monophosphatase
MANEINIPIILDAVKKIGNIFLLDYKKKNIPQSKVELFKLLEEIDNLCIDSLKKDLAIEFPNTPWLIGDEFDSESQKAPNNEAEYWLCDAMDGAIQYVQHIAGWSINLVLIRNGKPYLSVIFDPLANEIFWAKKGEGAFMNDTKLQLSNKTEASIMLAVFEYGHQDKTNNNLNEKIGTTITALLNNFGIVRNYGPHGLQLAYVGAGRIDLFVQEDFDTFNWIAGILIAKEAGAKILTTDGNPWQWGSESLLVAKKDTAQIFLNKINNK